MTNSDNNLLEVCYVDGWQEETNPSSKGGATLWEFGKEQVFSFKTDKKIITNNQVEIIAVILGLLISRNKTIVSDSVLAVNTITGKWHIREEALVPLVLLGRLIYSWLDKEIIWERRDTNLAGIYNDEHFLQATKPISQLRKLNI